MTSPDEIVVSPPSPIVEPLGRRLGLSTRRKWSEANSPPLRPCCQNWAKWSGLVLLLYSGLGGLGGRLDLSRREIDAGFLAGVICHREIPQAADPGNARRTDLSEVGVTVEPGCRPGAAIGVVVDGGLMV